MSSSLFQNTIIPIQVTLFGMHHYFHDLGIVIYLHNEGALYAQKSVPS